LLIDFRTVHHTKPGPQKNPKPKQQTRPWWPPSSISPLTDPKVFPYLRFKCEYRQQDSYGLCRCLNRSKSGGTTDSNVIGRTGNWNSSRYHQSQGDDEFCFRQPVLISWYQVKSTSNQNTLLDQSILSIRIQPRLSFRKLILLFIALPSHFQVARLSWRNRVSANGKCDNYKTEH
jgi:hypothetical protein